LEFRGRWRNEAVNRLPPANLAEDLIHFTDPRNALEEIRYRAIVENKPLGILLGKTCFAA
jgi:hypothetical protein